VGCGSGRRRIDVTKPEVDDELIKAALAFAIVHTERMPGHVVRPLFVHDATVALEKLVGERQAGQRLRQLRAGFAKVIEKRAFEKPHALTAVDDPMRRWA
jgi:hypothetical protein